MAAVELKLPELGENIESGEVVKLLVGIGEQVEKDQPVFELETGKATVEVPATAAGKVTAIHVQQGATVKVGQAVLTLEDGGAAAAERPAAKAEKPERAERREAPPLSSANAAAAQPDVVPPKEQTEPERADRSPPPPPSPTAAPGAPGTGASRVIEMRPREHVGGVIAAPHVRQFAREVGVEIGQVAGSGPGGRVSVEDVKRHARDARAAGVSAPRALAAVQPKLPDFSRFGPIERVPMNAVRKATVEQMALAWSVVPRVTLQAKADLTELEALRQRYKGRAEAAGGKLTITALLLKVVAGALRDHPALNASADVERRELILKKYVHIGVATDTPRGLLVPVVRDVDRKGLVPLSVELTQLSARAREGKLAPAEMEGASFTVTNLGGMGISHFSAIVNPPEVAILSVGKAEHEPVWDGSEFKPRLRVPLAINLDHRVVDGADGARFLARVVEGIQDPVLMAL